MFQLPQLNEPAELASVKCPQCKEVTPTEWIRISPEWIEGPSTDVTTVIPNPMDLLKLTKRLSLCTNCGNMRLTN